MNSADCMISFDATAGDMRELLDALDECRRAFVATRAAMSAGDTVSAQTSARSAGRLAAMSAQLAVGVGLRRVAGATDALTVAKHALEIARAATQVVAVRTAMHRA